jgi:hypothetical protein
MVVLHFWNAQVLKNSAAAGRDVGSGRVSARYLDMVSPQALEPVLAYKMTESLPIYIIVILLDNNT